MYDVKPNARIPGEFLVQYEDGQLISAGANTFGKIYIDPDGLKPIVYDLARERYFHIDMVDASDKARVIGYAPLESAIQIQIELEKLRQVLAIFEANAAQDDDGIISLPPFHPNPEHNFEQAETLLYQTWTGSGKDYRQAE